MGLYVTLKLPVERLKSSWTFDRELVAVKKAEKLVARMRSEAFDQKTYIVRLRKKEEEMQTRKQTEGDCAVDLLQQTMSSFC